MVPMLLTMVEFITDHILQTMVEFITDHITEQEVDQLITERRPGPAYGVSYTRQFNLVFPATNYSGVFYRNYPWQPPMFEANGADGSNFFGPFYSRGTVNGPQYNGPAYTVNYGRIYYGNYGRTYYGNYARSRPGPAYGVSYGRSRPGPAYAVNYGRSRPGPAYGVSYGRSRPGPAYAVTYSVNYGRVYYGSYNRAKTWTSLYS